MTVAIFPTSEHPTLRQIRDLYEGRGLSAADSPAMSGAAIAAAFGVHPHSIDAWKKRWGWQRPAWYRRGRPLPVTRGERSQEALRAELLAIVRAAAGKPCPSNVELARAARISTGTLVAHLRHLVEAGELASEARGPYRRLTLKDGAGTGWTAKINGRETALQLGIACGGQPRSADAAVLALVRRAADLGLPCPSNARLAQAAACTKDTARRTLARLVRAGAFTIERRTLPGRRPDRCIVFGPGVATGWESGDGQALRLDPAVLAAERALRRQGIVVFDVAVHTGTGWGIAWSVDGAVMGRAALLELAARRAAQAIEALQAGSAQP